MQKHHWSGLTKQQVGAYAEYFTKMELTKRGFQVYTTEVDDRGIDFVARHKRGPYLEIQVKSLRKFGYVFMQKHKFHLEPNFFLMLVLMTEGCEPDLYLIPSLQWTTADSIFTDRNYGGGLKSKAEWGLNVSARNMEVLKKYRFDDRYQSLLDNQIAPLGQALT